MKGKIISTLLILVGICLLLYPKANEYYQNYQQQKLLNQWQESLAVIDNSGFANETNDTDYNDLNYNNLFEGENPSYVLDGLQDEQVNQENTEEIDGMLSIDKIDLNLPILKGASKENLSISIASLDKTSPVGTEGNYSLAGHRSHTYGRNFNRLDELDVGDIIEVTTRDNIFKYEITDKLYVQPEETWVLKSEEDQKEITLITCHPMINPDQRLIIKGELTSE